MNNFSKFQGSITNSYISGWGRTNQVKSKLVNFRNQNDLEIFLKESKNKSFITRGLGRSYGDAAQLKDGYVSNVSFLKDISISGNKVTVGAGIKLNELLEKILPLGYFLPVSPGSANVTIGGAIAADVHGKNHHRDGSLGNHITRILILDGKGQLQELKPKIKDSSQINKYFWATIGGMGLTGVIIEATISLIKVETAFMKVDTFICQELEELMTVMKEKDNQYKYSVAWVDSLHKKNRGVLTCGEHAKTNELDSKYQDVLNYDSNNLVSAPNLFPNGLLNKFTVKAFNEIWFRKSSLDENIQPISKFFYPLDGVNNWNRIYGNKGFHQYQFVVPDENAFFISKTLRKLKEASANSFLTVLKRFGKANNSFLSFPDSGWTLAIDLPGNSECILDVLDELDNELATLGGKVYLAKDSRQSPQMFKKSYLKYQEWKSIKSEMDPLNFFQSDLSRRLLI